MTLRTTFHLTVNIVGTTQAVSIPAQLATDEIPLIFLQGRSVKKKKKMRLLENFDLFTVYTVPNTANPHLYWEPP